MVDDPILVTGLPRSGTSLVTGILAACGAWVGQTYPPDPYNRKGNQENCTIREDLLKPYLRLLGVDPLGLSHLPAPATDPLLPGEWWRARVEGVIRSQGGDGAWAYKDAKLCLMWRQWAEAFPKARWIVVRRDTDAIIASCIRAEPMVRRMGDSEDTWAAWAEGYLGHIRSMPHHLEIWPDQGIFAGTEQMMDLIERLGLEWNDDAVNAFVDRGLWH